MEHNIILLNESSFRLLYTNKETNQGSLSSAKACQSCKEEFGAIIQHCAKTQCTHKPSCARTLKFYANTFLMELNVWNQSNQQHLLGVQFPNLCDCISAYQFKHFNCCEIFVITSFIVQLELLFWALLVGRVYNRVYEWFPPHFTLVINRLKLQFDQSLFYYINSYPTMNPTHPPWLITKPSWFIRSTSCGYEPKITLPSSSKQS